jgi:hypothetical protein
VRPAAGVGAPPTTPALPQDAPTACGVYDRCQQELRFAWQTESMPTGDLTVTEDASPGEWIAPRLKGEFGAVTLAVSSGYAAYARICHPASDREGRSVTWSDVARATGRTAHPLMQWHALVGSSDPLNFKGSLWPGSAPERGNLTPRLLEELCRRLGKHTTDPEHCCFALWIGWVHGGGDIVRAEHVGTSSTPQPQPIERAPAAFSADELSWPRPSDAPRSRQGTTQPAGGTGGSRAQLENACMRLAMYEQSVRTFEDEVRRRDADLDRLHRSLDSVHASVSWRITAPLRAAKRGMKRLHAAPDHRGGEKPVTDYDEGCRAAKRNDERALMNTSEASAPNRVRARHHTDDNLQAG